MIMKIKKQFSFFIILSQQIIEKNNHLPNLDEILDSIPDDFDYPEDISEFVDSQVVGEELL